MAPFYSNVDTSKFRVLSHNVLQVGTTSNNLNYYIHLTLSLSVVRFQTLLSKVTFDCHNYFTLKG